MVIWISVTEYHIVLLIIFILESLLTISLQFSGFIQSTLGQKNHVICSFSVPPDVDPDTIELGWLNEDDIITDDSRVTVYLSDYFNHNLVTFIQFDPLIEEDEGEYICYVVMNGSLIFEFIDLQNFTSTYVHYFIYYICSYQPEIQSHAHTSMYTLEPIGQFLEVYILHTTNPISFKFVM